MSKDESPASFFFKLFATGLILAPALGIVAAASGNPMFGRLALLALMVAGGALVIGIVVRIWE